MTMRITTKEDIIEAFIKRLAEYGYDGFTMHELAEDVGYSSGSAFFKHYQNKLSMMEPAIDVITTRIAEQVQTFEDCKFLVRIWLDDYTKNVLLTRKKVKRRDFQKAFEVVSSEV